MMINNDNRQIWTWEYLGKTIDKLLEKLEISHLISYNFDFVFHYFSVTYDFKLFFNTG